MLLVTNGAQPSGTHLNMQRNNKTRKPSVQLLDLISRPWRPSLRTPCKYASTQQNTQTLSSVVRFRCSARCVSKMEPYHDPLGLFLSPTHCPPLWLLKDEPPTTNNRTTRREGPAECAEHLNHDYRRGCRLKTTPWPPQKLTFVDRCVVC